MNRYLYYLLIPLIGAVLFFNPTKDKEEPDFFQGREHYGTLILSSEIEGLPIYIDEKQVGVTQKGPQSFSLPTVGVYGKADHEVVVQKEIDATHEYYFYQTFAFNRYIDVEENPIKKIALFSFLPANDTFPPINHAIDIRLKPELLAKKTGLVQSMKLRHNHAWHMAQDESRIYVLSKADKDLYRKSKNEAVEGEFIEVYDKETFAFIDQRQLSFENDTFSTYCSVAVDEDTIYIGDRNAQLLRLNKQSLEPSRDSEKINGFPEAVLGLVTYKDYLIAYGEGDRIAVFKANELLYSIDEKQNYPHNIEEIHDYWEYNRINSVAVHNGVLYATNWRGFVNAYALEDGHFIRQINSIKFEEEWGYVVGPDIEASAIYQDRYLYFSIDYKGVLIIDTQTGKISNIETLFPKKIVYSELVKEDLDMTKKTDIYKMLFYRHFLIFSEVNALQEFVYAYDLESGRIVHTFQGHQGDITELFLNGNHLTGLSHEGMLYRWDLSRLGEE